MVKVIIEGPDCSGKTTLARAGFPDFNYLHLGPPPTYAQTGGVNKLIKHPAWHQNVMALEEALPVTNVVFDRLMYGELIYAPALKRETDLTKAHVRMLERILLGERGVLILCQTDYPTTLDLWQKRKAQELVQDEETFSWIYNEYLELPSIVSLPTLHFDMKNPPLETPANDRLIDWVEAAAPPHNQGPGYGHFKPGVTLIVGEQVNPYQGHSDWPFVSYGGSSWWLANLLSAANVSERDLYWINALDVACKPAPVSFIDRLQPAEIIALGAIAVDWCKHHQLAATEFYHPAYWKRFRSNEPYPLVDYLHQKYHGEHQRHLPNGATRPLALGSGS